MSPNNERKRGLSLFGRKEPDGVSNGEGAAVESGADAHEPASLRRPSPHPPPLMLMVDDEDAHRDIAESSSDPRSPKQGVTAGVQPPVGAKSTFPVKGICAKCGLPVTADQPRTKDSTGRYAHKVCPVARVSGEWRGKVEGAAA